jgi:hypothetical protein
MQIITGNSLGDGRVVFRTADGTWSLAVGDAALHATKEAVAAAMTEANADAAANRVVEPYAIEVTVTGGHIEPLRLRERIRVDGPTTGNSRPRAARSEAA